MQTCLREPAVCITICFINAITRIRAFLPYRQSAKKQNCQEVRSKEQSVIWRGQDLSTKSKGTDQTAATAVIYISWANKSYKFQKRNRSAHLQGSRKAICFLGKRRSKDAQRQILKKVAATVFLCSDENRGWVHREPTRRLKPKQGYCKRNIIYAKGD